MKTLTLRNVPDEVADYLSSLAKEARQSVNATVIQVLHKSMGGQPMTHRKRDLGAFSGTWSAEQLKSFEKGTEGFGKIDQEMWRS